MIRFARFVLVVLSIVITTTIALAQQYDQNLFSAMKWRLVGPHRAGRVTAVAGIPGNAKIYYFGTPGGGLWKTTDGGRVWKPIFDDAHVASIGALAIAPSNPNIIYVGTGEQLNGKGVFKSTDGGATWTNVGLEDTLRITSSSRHLVRLCRVRPAESSRRPTAGAHGTKYSSKTIKRSCSTCARRRTILEYFTPLLILFQPSSTKDARRASRKSSNPRTQARPGSR